LVENGRIVAGQRVEGVLVLDAPEEIPRAEEIDMLFESEAWIAEGKYGNSKVMFQAPFEIDLPKGAPFAAGEHRYPFVLDVPEWLPPALEGGTFGIRHVIKTRLDVDWAVDPTAHYRWPPVHMPPRTATRRPLTTRSRPGFFGNLVVEITLLSSTIALGEPIQGQIALRNGHDADFPALDLALTSNFTLVFDSGGRRHTPLSRVRLSAERLRAGETLSFSFPTTPPLQPSYKTAFIDHDVSIVVSIPVSAVLSDDPAFEVPLDVLPETSIVQGSVSTSLLGGDRVRQLAAAMARETGLTEGAHAPVLAYGNVGLVSVSMTDAPRLGKLGVDVDFTFPDLQLGILFRKRGVLEGLVGAATSPFLPPALWDRHLAIKPHDARPKLDDAALLPFFRAVFGGSVEEARLSDHHFGAHVTIIDDEPQRMIELAREVCAQAKRIGDAIRALPFPEALKSARAAWQATADEQNAFLVPTSPSISGLVFRAQILGGEERTIRVDLRSIWNSEVPLLQARIDVRDASIPEASRHELDGDGKSPWLATVRSIFPGPIAFSGGIVLLNGATWPHDPRTLFPTLESFLGWILEARGERRVDAPYR
jgi:hypothetical protein